MCLCRGSGIGSMAARTRAVRALYRSLVGQNGPEARARRLLREWLSPGQGAQFDAEGHFEVIGSHTGRRYRIHQGTVSNLLELDEEGSLRSSGVSFPNVPWRPATSCLLRRLALETDEKSVLALANGISPKLPRLHQVVRQAY